MTVIPRNVMTIAMIVRKIHSKYFKNSPKLHEGFSNSDP